MSEIENALSLKVCAIGGLRLTVENGMTRRAGRGYSPEMGGFPYEGVLARLRCHDRIHRYLVFEY